MPEAFVPFLELGPPVTSFTSWFIRFGSATYQCLSFVTINYFSLSFLLQDHRECMKQSTDRFSHQKTKQNKTKQDTISEFTFLALWTHMLVFLKRNSPKIQNYKQFVDSICIETIKFPLCCPMVHLVPWKGLFALPRNVLRFTILLVSR